MTSAWFVRYAPRLRAAAKAALWHLCISVLIALAAGIVVFGLWYPFPYRNLSGGLHLFVTLVSVDVVCGPLLTFILFNPAKSWREMIVDFSLIGLIQLAALLYGMHVVAQARPVIVAFEVDRLVAVSAEEIDHSKLHQALPPFQRLSWSGPRLVGTRQAKPDEVLKSVQDSLNGVEPSARPNWWQPYEQSVPAIQKRMRKVTDLWARLTPAQQHKLDQAEHATGLPMADLYYLPLTSAKQLDSWIVLLNNQGQIVGFAPLDGFPPDHGWKPAQNR